MSNTNLPILLLLNAETDQSELTDFLSIHFQLYTTSTLDQALDNLKSQKPLSVLVDMDRPGWAEEIPRFTKQSAVVLALTASEDQALNKKAFALGVKDSLIKTGINPKDIVREIRHALDRQKLLKQLEKVTNECRECETRFHDIAYRVEHGLWVRSADGKKCIYLNPAFEKIWGRNLEEMNKQSWAETIHPDDRENANQIYLKHRYSNKDYIHTYRVIRPNGDIRWVQNQAYSVIDKDGKLLRMSGIARDITLEREQEESLRLSQKLESLGQLSAGIAHEINTPSQYISDNISFLTDAMTDIADILIEIPTFLNQGDPGNTHKTQKLSKLYQDADTEFLIEEIPLALKQAKNGIEHIKKIVQAMKGFSHPGEDMVEINLNSIISNSIIVAKNEWKYVAEVITELDDELPLVCCIPSAINQVILNILINAAHAIAEVDSGSQLGRITVSTRSENGQAIIQIKDTGPGIPEQIRKKVFDPFFTTKEVGVGTGQGLAIAHKIIAVDHKGSITVDSEIGKGTCFTMRLNIDRPIELLEESA